MRGFKNKVLQLLGSRRLYWAIIAFFVFEALWIALSANYPMAFDEDFHLGVINIYSQHWSPILHGQPQGANSFGALAADPSYLYHYLMSFPYRLVSLFTDSQVVHVMVLRVLNIAMITAGVVLFGKVLLRAGTSRPLTSVATLLFALIPTVPLLAGQINYDNLLLLMVALVCWLVLLVTEQLKARTLDLKTCGLLAVALMLASLVKYAFLPLALTVFGYVVVLVCKTLGRRKFLPAITKSYAGLSRAWKFGLLALLVISTGLFLQRYALNTLDYGHPVPDCDKVIGVEACMEYGPWGRNYRLAAAKTDFDPNPLAYTWVWLQGLHYRMFFVISGPPKHTNYPPALLPSAAAVVLLLSGVTALLLYWRQVFAGRPFLLFLLLLPVVYGAFLWGLQNYPQFVETGQPVAINGRYFIPLLFPLAAVWGRALSVACRPWPVVKIWAAGLVVALFLQAGGVFSFILRSDQSWYWPNGVVIKVNQTAQHVLSHTMYIGPKHYN
jgi:hypothetical protein